MKNRPRKSFVAMLALVLGMAYTQFAPAQTFKRVKVYGGVPLVQVSAGGTSVWALAANGTPYIYKGTQFVLANTISLTQIAVGGGNLRQKDTVWALDSSGNIYHASKSGTSWVFNQMPGILSFIAVGIGDQDKCHPYEVWGLNPSSLIYRFNYCLGNWEQIAGALQTLSVGSGDVWGINGNGQVFYFIFYKKIFIEWLPGFYGSRIALSPGATWVLKLNALWESVPGPTGFEDLQSPYLTDVRAGGDGVWSIDNNGRVFSQSNSRMFTPIPGVFASINVGSGGGVWAIDSSGQVYAFSTP